MAGGGRIKGITIEIDGDTTGLSKALKGVDSSLKDTQSQLKDVNKLLKMDPKNTELLRQKQDLLGKAIEDTKKKLETQKQALEQLSSVANPTEEMKQQQDALRREIIATEGSLKDYQKQLKDMPSALSQVSDATAKAAEKTKVLSAAAAGIGAAMLTNAVKSAAAADDLATLSAQTGLSVEELQKMQYASNLVDVSVEDMTGSVKKLTQQMGKGADVFDKLGVAITDENGEMRSATDVWYDSLQALSQVQNETERDALSMELFGKSASNLTGIIDDGGEAMKSLGQEAEDLGLVMSGDAVQSAVEFNNQMDLMKQRVGMAFMEMGSSLATTLVPALEKLVDIVTQVVTWFSDLDGTTQAVILTVVGLVAAISPVLGLISTLTGLAAGLNVAMLPMLGTIAGIVAVVAVAVAAGVALYQNWDTIKAKATELYETVKGKFDAMREAVSGAIERIKQVLSSFSWKLPDIKLPHFKITGGEAPYGFMGKGSFPSIDVEWYKKAYNNAMMFKDPTVLATPYGLKGFGDGNGSELVIGTDTLMGMINGANSKELQRIESLLEYIAANGTPVVLQGDAAKLFKAVRQQNTKFKGSTGKSAFDY